jgi:hypothetical protein
MSEIVERVARRIAMAQLTRQYVDLDYLAGKKTDSPNLLGAAIEIDSIWHTFVPEARAAIAAMRQPTDAMCAAVDDFDVYWGYNADGRPGSRTAVWQAMIDEALK